jgi:hypothetical protein
MGLDTVELILSIEKSFSIDIPTTTAAKLTTVGQLHQFIVSELNRLNRPRINEHIVFDQLRIIICSQLGVNPEQVVPSASIVGDLGAD